MVRRDCGGNCSGQICWRSAYRVVYQLRVLFHEADWGGDMVRLSARFGRGLPADVIPVEVSSVEGVGHAEMLAALGVGFASVHLMPGPRTDREVIDRELTLARAIALQTEAASAKFILAGLGARCARFTVRCDLNENVDMPITASPTAMSVTCEPTRVTTPENSLPNRDSS